MIAELAPYSMINDNIVMMLFIVNIIAMSYVFIMNGAGILERLKCMFYYESKSTPFNDRTHITRICNVLMYMQTLFYATIISVDFITKDDAARTSDTVLSLAGLLVLCFAGALIFKRFSYDAVNTILFNRQVVTEWRSLYFFTIKLLGFFLAPAAVTIIFFPEISFNFVKIYLLFVLIIYVYTIITGLIKIIFPQRRNFLDIFLYLCALEFLPMGIVWKFILQMS